MCQNDSWAGRTSNISQSGTLAVTISAQTNVFHFGGQQGHPFCHGDFYAKAVLISGFGPSCQTGPASRHHSTLGEGTNVLAQRQCTGLNYDSTYHAGGIHWGFGESEHYSESPGSVYFPSPPPAPCNCDSSEQCCVSTCQGTWDPGLGECNEGSPILINPYDNRPNYHLTSAEDGVLFDLKARGVARRVAWTQAASSAAFLALDRNANGRIDDGSELFGTATPGADAGCVPNGFNALVQVDDNRDGQIDSADPVYTALRLWTDRNHNGLSEADELATLPEAGVNVIYTSYVERRRRDEHGNWYRFEGTALVQKRNGREVARRVYDVFLMMLLQ
jgi:hypothetical protein